MIHPLIEKKAKRVGTWDHSNSGIVVEYFLEGTKFVCVVLEEKLSAPEASVLKDKAMDRLEHWIKMEWHPVMVIEVEDKSPGGYRDEPQGDGLAIGVKRFYLSRSPAGRVYECDWDVDEIHRKAKMTVYSCGRYDRNEMTLTKLPLCAPYKINDDRTMIDYSDEVWAAVQGLIVGLGEMRVKLGKLIRSRDGFSLLVQGGTKLLSAGK